MITGVGGFLGGSLARRIHSSRYSLYGMDKVNIKVDFPFWKGDVESEKFFQEYVDKDLGYIFHFGSPCSILQFNEDPVGCLKNTVLGFRNVLKLASVVGAKLIFPSSGNIYGDLKPPHKEWMVPKPTNLYGVGKYISEKFASDNYVVKSIALRIFTGYGPGEEKKGKLASVVWQFLEEMRAGRRPVVWGDGEQVRDCIFVDDIVEACLKSMEVNHSMVINVGSGVKVSYNEIIGTINKVLGTDIKVSYVDKPAGYVDKAVADISLLKEKFNMEPIGLEEGLRRCVRYLDEGRGKA